MKKYRVTSGKYEGRIGYGIVTKYGSVMFYPIEGTYPYRVCLMTNEVVLNMEEAQEVFE